MAAREVNANASNVIDLNKDDPPASHTTKKLNLSAFPNHNHVHGHNSTPSSYLNDTSSLTQAPSSSAHFVNFLSSQNIDIPQRDGLIHETQRHVLHTQDITMVSSFCDNTHQLVNDPPCHQMSQPQSQGYLPSPTPPSRHHEGMTSTRVFDFKSETERPYRYPISAYTSDAYHVPGDLTQNDILLEQPAPKRKLITDSRRGSTHSSHSHSHSHSYTSSQSLSHSFSQVGSQPNSSLAINHHSFASPAESPPVPGSDPTSMNSHFYFPVTYRRTFSSASGGVHPSSNDAVRPFFANSPSSTFISSHAHGRNSLSQTIENQNRNLNDISSTTTDIQLEASNVCQISSQSRFAS